MRPLRLVSTQLWGGPTAERADDLLHVQSSLDGKDDALGYPEVVGAGEDDLVDRLYRLAGLDRADMGDGAPRAFSTGRACSTSRSSPPTNIVRVAFLAPSLPPDTGASTMRSSRSRRRAAKSQLLDGAMVEQSMINVPERAADATPSSPKSTASTSGVSDTQMTTSGVSATASAGEATSRRRDPPTWRATGRAIPGRDRETGTGEIGRHRGTHRAQTEERDLVHGRHGTGLLRLGPSLSAGG